MAYYYRRELNQKRANFRHTFYREVPYEIHNEAGINSGTEP
jgi:hypothetical protein